MAQDGERARMSLSKKGAIVAVLATCLIQLDDQSFHTRQNLHYVDWSAQSHEWMKQGAGTGIVLLSTSLFSAMAM
jgi:hypothetical protein